MNANNSFGSWLRQRRKALDLTQYDLADQVGCSVVTIRKIEADERRPSKQIAEHLADVLAISMEERAEFIAFARHTETVPATPPLPNTAVKPRHNLPPQPTSFIGRTDELAQIAERLADPNCRLLTLVGAGGIGKTRLALQAAANQIANFGDGVYFVSLTGVGASNLVASAIASALAISFYGPEDPDVQLVHYLMGKTLLLVLDNLEHLLDTTGLLTNIQAAAPAVKLLATSRECLNLEAEWVITLEGLLFPQDGATNQLEAYSAVQLFVQRARQIQASFSLEQNAEAVLTICRCVEGMPLGLELAASWLRGMSCSQVAVRTERSLDFLVTPARNVPERHGSLRAVFEQSWRLLSDSERRVLAALSVFRGGFDLDAAEHVAAVSPSVLVRLADKSLIRLSPSGRYDLHELLRQFASDKLGESGETGAIARRHLEFYVRLAEQAETNLYGPYQENWFDRLEVENDNLDAAVDWSLSDNKVEMGLRLTAALGFFWEFRAYYSEGLTWMEKLLANVDNASEVVQAKALRVAGMLSGGTADYEHAKAYCEESLDLARTTGDKASIAWALAGLAWYTNSANDSRRVWLEQALVLFREIGDGFGISHMLRRLAGTMKESGDYVRARMLAEEALMLARAAKDKNATAWSLLLLGMATWFEHHDPQQTWPLIAESLSLAREIRDPYLAGCNLRCLGEVAQTQKDYNRTYECYAESLTTFWDIRRQGQVATVLVKFGELAEVEGLPKRAATLLGSASAFVESDPDPHSNTEIERGIHALRAQLGEAAFSALWAEGQAMTAEQAVAYALEK